MTIQGPFEIELPFSLDSINANVLDVLGEFIGEKIERITETPGVTLLTQRIYIWQPWRRWGVCGEIRLITLGPQNTRVRIFPPPEPTPEDCYAALLDEKGITVSDGPKRLYNHLYHLKYRSYPTGWNALIPEPEIESMAAEVLNQCYIKLKENRWEAFNQVISRLAQVLKFTLPVSTLTTQADQVEHKFEKDEDIKPEISPALPADATQLGKSENIKRPTENAHIALIVVDEESLPNIVEARQIYGDYSPETAIEIVRALPEAYRKYQKAGGRWGPKWVAKEVNINATTVSRYLRVFYQLNILEINRVPLPYSPKSPHQT